jgi:hypothetical protein
MNNTTQLLSLPFQIDIVKIKVLFFFAIIYRKCSIVFSAKIKPAFLRKNKAHH